MVSSKKSSTAHIAPSAMLFGVHIPLVVAREGPNKLSHMVLIVVVLPGWRSSGVGSEGKGNAWSRAKKTEGHCPDSGHSGFLLPPFLLQGNMPHASE